MKRALFALLAVLAICGTASAQGYHYSQPILNSRGLPVPGANAAICTTIATTAAAVSGNLATLTMASNPSTAGFTPGSVIVVTNFTGADTYFNGTWGVASVSSTQITFSLIHGNASAATNGNVVQKGTAGAACAPLATLYTDQTATTTAPNPLTSDGFGNLNFWSASGQFFGFIYGPTVTPTLYPISVPVTTVTSLANVAYTNVANTFTQPQTINGNTLIEGPTPHVDAAAYGARPITVAGYATTGTISGTSASLALAGAAQFKNGDGISVYGAGATCSLSTPSAPTVTPSESAHATGIGVDVNAPSGSTSFAYEIVALGTWSATAGSNCWGAYSIASTAGTTSTGNTLGVQTATISTESETSGTMTITCTCVVSTGAVVWISGTTVTTPPANIQTFDGSYVVLAGGTNSFTVPTGQNTSYTLAGTGGTLAWYNNNHVTWSAITGAFEYAIYGRTSAGYNLLGFSWPGVLWFDDYGTTMTDAGTHDFYGWLPSTAPAATQNGVLTTTVLAGGATTTLTLAAAATNSVTSSFTTFDEEPLFAQAATAAKTGGGPLFIPCNSSNSGTRYVMGSYWQLPTGLNVQACGALSLDAPMEWQADLNWFGQFTGTNNGAAPVGLIAGGEIDEGMAYPAVYSNDPASMFIDHTYLWQYPGTNDGLLSYMQNGGGPSLIWNNSTWETGAQSAATDYMGIHLIVGPNNSSPDNSFTNDSWVAGPNQVANTTETPTVVIQEAGQFKIENCTMNRRAIAIVGNPALQVRKGCWVQGSLTPFIMSNGSSQSIGGNLVEGLNQDTSGEPVWANYFNAPMGGVVELDNPELSSPNTLTSGSGLGFLILKGIDGAAIGQTQNYALFNNNLSSGQAGSFYADIANAAHYQTNGLPSYVYLDQAFTTANNTNFQAIVGSANNLAWTMPLQMPINMPFSCHLVYSQATAAVSDSFGIQDVSVSPTNLQAQGSMETAAGTPAYGNATITNTTATAIVTATPGATATTYNVDLTGFVEQPANSATSVIQIMVKTTTGADAITVLKDSYCRLN